MLGWLISIAMLFSGCAHGNNVLVIASGLFAIAGSIGYGSNYIAEKMNSNSKKNESRNLQPPL